MLWRCGSENSCVRGGGGAATRCEPGDVSETDCVLPIRGVVGAAMHGARVWKLVRSRVMVACFSSIPPCTAATDARALKSGSRNIPQALEHPHWSARRTMRRKFPPLDMGTCPGLRCMWP
eukprot:1195410-Prorocentrum_minimum.AAC.15